MDADVPEPKFFDAPAMVEPAPADPPPAFPPEAAPPPGPSPYERLVARVAGGEAVAVRLGADPAGDPLVGITLSDGSVTRAGDAVVCALRNGVPTVERAAAPAVVFRPAPAAAPAFPSYAAQLGGT